LIGSGTGRYSLHFDGVNDFVDIPHHSMWSFGTGDFTIELWYKPEAITNSCSFAAQYDADGGVTIWRVSKANNSGGNKLNMYFVNNDVVVGSYSMTDAWNSEVEKWYHLVYERSGASGLIYINGSPQTLTETVAFGSNNLGDSSSELKISADWYLGGGQMVDGLIDNLRIYNTALSASEVQEHYSKELSRFNVVVNE
jgi:hypothetical protein